MYYSRLRLKEWNSLEAGFQCLKEFREMSKKLLSFWQMFKEAVVVQRAGVTVTYTGHLHMDVAELKRQYLREVFLSGTKCS